MKATGMRTAATLIGLACASAVAADMQQQMPEENVRPASCNDMEWHPDLQRNHPNLIGACQEAVVAGGQRWARFAANFTELRTNGNVVFTIHDRSSGIGRGGIVGDVTIEPAPGQMVYINERRTPFNELHPGQRVNLYVPEGQYGFSTLPGAPSTQVAGVAREDSSDGRMLAMRTQQRDPQAVIASLPATAGPLPWLAVGGALSMFGALGLGLRRRLVKHG
ncbi:MAG: hypothetical protein LC632_01170 [Xanthomonadaceae bacterium]|nr:hypothetical protein [Xanthomonadaceae bacterium]